jgi:hypothetical protein
LALSIISAIEQRPGRFLGQKNGNLDWVELTLEEKVTRTLLVLQRHDAAADEATAMMGVRAHDVLSGSGSVS